MAKAAASPTQTALARRAFLKGITPLLRFQTARSRNSRTRIPALKMIQKLMVMAVASADGRVCPRPNPATGRTFSFGHRDGFRESAIRSEHDSGAVPGAPRCRQWQR